MNQIRGILAEQGIVIARDIWRLRRALAEITGHATDDLNPLVRVLVMEVQAELMELDCRPSTGSGLVASRAGKTSGS